LPQLGPAKRATPRHSSEEAMNKENNEKSEFEKIILNGNCLESQFLSKYLCELVVCRKGYMKVTATRAFKDLLKYATWKETKSGLCSQS